MESYAYLIPKAWKGKAKIGEESDGLSKVPVGW